ncbi:trypsin eta-like [Drosophila tropicalis]|uniref:trypsin eta-like n=1 Tax=Drosophila tropicalis TaxID=46794 RepID=UPI0035ABD2EB
MVLSQLKCAFFIILHLSCSLILVYGRSARVIGGQDVSIYSVPYQVSLRYKSNQSEAFIHRCAGTIYSSEVILTTATCVQNVNAKQLHVIAGETYRTGSKGSIYLVNRIVIHPEFDMWLMDNDLALVVLTHHINLDGLGVSTIGLAEVEPNDASEAVVAGWGGISSEESSVEVLKLSYLQTVGLIKCRKFYGEDRITLSMLCAGGKQGDTCAGDAGGALVVNDLAVGLVSWGRKGCGLTDFPGVYTNLVYYSEWIQEETAKNLKLN